MIERLQGRLVRKQLTVLCLEVGPLWVEVMAPLSTSEHLSPEGEEVSLWTHLVWKEDGPSLYGFTTQEERAVFRLLLQAQGVGPRIALSILAHLTPAELLQEVRAGSVDRFTQVPGVGAKTAQRILLELRPKAAQLEAMLGPPARPGSRPGAGEGDAVQALTALGYPAREARLAVEQSRAENPDAPLDECLRLALRHLSGSSQRSRR